MVALTPDGRFALTSGPAVRLWDLATGKEVRKFPGNQQVVTAVALSPDGRLALGGGLDGTVWLWDVQTGKILATYKSHRNWVWAVAFSPDGKRFASAGGGAMADGIYSPGDDFAIRVWDVPVTQAPPRVDPRRHRRSPAASPAGRINH